MSEKFNPPPQGETRNSATLRDFVKFCEERPQLRFWQALAVWEGTGGFVSISHGSSWDALVLHDDTWHREGK